MIGFHNDADARERIPKESSPCRNCGLLIIYTGQGRHPCAYCGHKVELVGGCGAGNACSCLPGKPCSGFDHTSDPPTCILCGEHLSPPLARLGSTSCLACPPTASYPMRFTHP